VCYVFKPITPDEIRKLFDSHNEPVLFVVDFDCIFPFGTTDAPLWIKALHAIYYGRIYVWIENGIVARHYDWANQETISSSPIDIEGILFTDTDCKLRDFPGVFHIARFYDKAFWKEQPVHEAPPKREKKQRQKPNTDDVYEAFKQAFREHMNNYGVNYDTPRRSAPSGDKWVQGFMSTGNLTTAPLPHQGYSA